MEVLEFIKQKERMCDYYDGGCTRDDSHEICPAHNMNCVLAANLTECFVAVVEQWAKEHPEEPSAATTHKNDEPCVKTIQNELEGAIYREIVSHKTRIENLDHDVYVIRNNLAVLGDQVYALREKVDHTPTKEPSQTPEPKRTNKDVLVAVFPDAYVYPGGVPMACPLSLDKHYDCCKFKNCEDCRCAHWLAEVEE